ncbi:hypothetical protein [Chitinophaga silvisoli]|uniref:Uncharacterized protein n=1 Tax=Chitinophaga silvisoli TaxID=2291814 RepID=A0A3E1NMM0_9BACT|nr:hypothetical protein [Chitinophaga silvisoli]RFM29185.1 hypothetical protein DXN04_33990 [Chitinophaga silvisoli]
MVQHFEIIQHILMETFEIGKMKSQLFEYLSIKEDEINTKQTTTGYEVRAYNNSLRKSESYLISLLDELTIYTYKIIDDSKLGFQCHIFVAIGDYQKVNQFFTTDKCIGIFKYDDELNLMEIEFFMEESYKP